jgi:3-polyprenyl-4-hydroxybenzoate decarboxylase
VQWHVATRVQPDRDYTIWEKGTGLPLDPSMAKEQAIYSGKVGIDATRKHAFPPRSLPPPAKMAQVKRAWLETACLRSPIESQGEPLRSLRRRGRAA